MSYARLIAYSIIPILTILVGVVFGPLACIAIGVIVEAAAIALFVGVRRKQRLELAVRASDRDAPTRRTA